MVMSNTFVLMFLLLFPLWDRWELHRLKLGKSGARAGFYLRTTAGLWIATIVLVQIHDAATYIVAPPVSLPFMGAQTLVATAQVLSLLVLALLILPVILLWFARSKRQRALAALDAIDYLLPVTARERLLFALVSLSAGVCEEIIYRGFLTHYFVDRPWALPLWAGLIAASLLFGLAHAGHGWTGILRTATLGFILGLLYVGTGSLILPIIIHACIDLRILAFAMMRSSPAGIESQSIATSPVSS